MTSFMNVRFIQDQHFHKLRYKRFLIKEILPYLLLFRCVYFSINNHPKITIFLVVSNNKCVVIDQFVNPCHHFKLNPLVFYLKCHLLTILYCTPNSVLFTIVDKKFKSTKRKLKYSSHQFWPTFLNV